MTESSQSPPPPSQCNLHRTPQIQVQDDLGDCRCRVETESVVVESEGSVVACISIFLNEGSKPGLRLMGTPFCHIRRRYATIAAIIARTYTRPVRGPHLLVLRPTIRDAPVDARPLGQELGHLFTSASDAARRGRWAARRVCDRPRSRTTMQDRGPIAEWIKNRHGVQDKPQGAGDKIE
ncbi:hypothetical protein BD310DRAFT_939660 [Dichomitus squalens]|uniref:Uncharacterized protein n=1 Tax=Dichomitus squalens TaxID=114155 RepID=A0A4Q9PDF9_9APHY|nr:hypothetical protein BD310DRAFT_939660 [Dichomitus squalens]